ncbi:MAG: 50S ribosomal protein L25 [Chloroflexi bacterium]|nr:50S ribosomal protein L25 [Chloroflexota bacterium]MCH8114208.1 50S ribosomal protein L25 [Chloroflexota bacterium]MCI0775614.1 50S ribosomal protein L25 [Chloroflexota bacterium]MCI0803227.1 50S ribosomal protein L25 [Chloroflexota bacterium]MCI0809104.1 50S ribosomal protein L25 [Chloroflexota bacterium]
MDAVTLNVEVRTALGKKNRALRRQGITPIHMYGLARESETLQVRQADLRIALRAAGRTTPVTLISAGGEETVTIVREIARHAVTGYIQHVDFQRVDIQQVVETPVPVSLIGQEDAPGTAGGAGVVTQGMFEILVRAKPFDVPNEIIVDTSGMEEIDSVILASEIPLPPGVEFAGNAEDRVCWIQPPRVTAEEDLVPVAEEIVAGEEVGAVAAEGEGEADESGESGVSSKED